MYSDICNLYCDFCRDSRQAIQDGNGGRILKQPENGNQSERFSNGHGETSDKAKQPDYDELEMREMDILNLPPRSEVHQNSKQKLSFKIKQPFARFIVFAVFIVAIVVLMIYLQLYDFIDVTR